MKLTIQQQALLDYIKKHQQATGTIPSQREIQKEFGFASRNAVPKHLAALEKKGLLQRSMGRARSLLITTEQTSPNFLHVPLIGAISAGFSEGAEERIDRTLAIDQEMLQLPPHAETFALQVRGDSMVEAGIFDSDLVILEKTEARVGDIVAALIDGESTLKRLIKEAGHYFLKAENPNYPNLIPLGELLIQGVFRALIRVQKKRL